MPSFGSLWSVRSEVIVVHTAETEHKEARAECPNGSRLGASQLSQGFRRSALGLNKDLLTSTMVFIRLGRCEWAG